MRINPVFCILLIFALGCLPFRADGQQKTLPVNHSWEAIKTAQPTSAQLDLIAEKLRHTKVRMGNVLESDSLCRYALTLANSSSDPNDYARALSLYFENAQLMNNSKEAIELASQWKKENSEDLNVTWQSHYYLCKAYTGAFEFEKAIENGHTALDLARAIGDSLKVAQSMTSLASALNSNLDKVPALKLLLRAQDLFEEENNDLAFYRFYDELRNFYLFINRFEECYIILDKQHELIRESNELDSLDVLAHDFWRSHVDFSNPEIEVDLDLIKRRLEFCNEYNFFALREEYMSSYRTLLVRNNDFKGLDYLYREIAPDHLLEMKETRLHDYYRMQAYFSESRNELDSAEYFWINAQTFIEETSDLYRLANFYIRFGEFYERNGNLISALEKFDTAVFYGERSGFLQFVLKAISAKERIHKREGRYKIAYALAGDRRDLEDSLKLINEEEKFLMTTVLYQSQLAQTEQAAQLRTEFLRSRFFGFGFVLFALLSGLIFFQFHLTRKAKQQSDSLLLNILPAETAQELKEHGATTARKYENVTILFADFVGFTVLSEKLSPNDLVNEIDLYFRAFDDIMTKYGLEKIKTIGDAYLAVGGMPTGNKARAQDVTKAAIAMQEVVEEINSQKENRNLALRIGLHTGEVVAGVVGVTKFQYDVWGDAVNIAARMEQNSKPGKINISQSTSEQVKGAFKLEHRGAIEAKNKGLLEMYFVSKS